MSKLFNTLCSVVHGKTDTTLSGIIVDLCFYFATIFWFKDNCKLTGLINFEICGSVLVTKCMSANNDWFFPSGYESGDVFNNDRLSEDGSI